jgi:hypothetical protein
MVYRILTTAKEMFLNVCDHVPFEEQYFIINYLGNRTLEINKSMFKEYIWLTNVQKIVS